MKRRQFIKGCLGVTAAGIIVPWSSHAAVSRTLVDEGVSMTALSPSQVPQIISVFLYGGASEFALNFNHIDDAKAVSETPYPSEFNNDSRTTNGFWREAGGDLIEAMLARKDLSVYRTVYRELNDNKAHLTSVRQNLVGQTDIERPGLGTQIARIISENNPFDKAPESLRFPVVSFEGNSYAYQRGGLGDPRIREVALNANLTNPFARYKIDNHLSVSQDEILDDLALRLGANSKFASIRDALAGRATLDAGMQSLLAPDLVQQRLDGFNQSAKIGEEIIYPDNRFGEQVHAAISLVLENPETLFVSLGSGMGHWDDHSEALTTYPERHSELIKALYAGMNHLRAASNQGHPRAGNVLIYFNSDFGRNMSLNPAGGWDHGNNQSVLTLGGWNLRAQSLGKIVGETELTDAGKRRKFTVPTASSYRCEPFAVAASMYRYFGVNNPQLLSASSPIDELQPGIVLR